MGGYVVTAPPATAHRLVVHGSWASVAAVAALASAGFRRYATYRQATLAAATTNAFFGFLRCFVLLAVAAASPARVVAGYDPAQLALYCWVSQGLIGVIGLWGWTELGDRIRSGDVVGDLLRPIHPVLSYLGTDLGRAAHASMTRFVVPVACGAVFFTLHVPARWSTYPVFLLSTGLALVVCFGGRYLINAAGFWLLDVRGVTMAWTFGTSALAGLAFPLHVLPHWLTLAIWVATPFPSMLQAPLDVIVERGSTPYLLGVVAGQVAWAAVLLGLCWYVQRRAMAKLVIQGG
jgi:ABC-2 type transport system permease protein